MGLDMWNVKLKDNKNFDGGNPWDLVEPEERDIDIDEYISKENMFYGTCLFDDNLIYSLIQRVVIPEMGENLTFEGHPILNPIEFKEIVKVLNKWVEEKWDNRSIFEISEDEVLVFECEKAYGGRISSKKFITDVNEYLTAIANNDCTMWFSR